MLEAIPGLGKLLDYFSNERRRRDDLMDSALAAIYAAANETKIYLTPITPFADSTGTWQTGAC